MVETTTTGHIIEIFHSPMTDGGSVATYKDVTEQRRIEEALRESERRYRLLAENASDLITRQTPDGTVLYVSPAVLTLLGFEADMMIGRRLIDYVHSNDRARFERHQKALLTHGADRVTVRLRHAGGDYVWLETSARVVRDRSSGRIIELQSASRDVTERVEAERALAEKSTLLQATLDNMMQGLCLLDGDLRIKLYNKRYLELLDLDEHALPLGMKLEDLLRYLTRKGEFGPVESIEDEVQRHLRQATRPIPTRWERTRPGGCVLDHPDLPVPRWRFRRHLQRHHRAQDRRTGTGPSVTAVADHVQQHGTGADGRGPRHEPNRLQPALSQACRCSRRSCPARHPGDRASPPSCPPGRIRHAGKRRTGAGIRRALAGPDSQRRPPRRDHRA